MQQPKTAAGRALLANLNGSYPRTEPHPEQETYIARASRKQYEIDRDAILAIEAEAAAGTALDADALRAALHSCVELNGIGKEAKQHILDHVPAEYARLAGEDSK